MDRVFSLNIQKVGFANNGSYTDMFRALKKSGLPQDHVYSVTVGASSKQTDASWHLLEPADVISTIQLLNSSSNQDH
jgi:trehalose 6-phosphate synthase/phosphatase